VKAHASQGVFSLPINLLTINQFFGKKFNPAEARAFIAGLGDPRLASRKILKNRRSSFSDVNCTRRSFTGIPANNGVVSRAKLPASILKRLPVRFNYDDNYYSTQYQGIPEDGYTSIIENILDHPNIEVRLKTRFSPGDGSGYEHVFYTGPIDAYFGFKEGRLAIGRFILSESMPREITRATP